MTNRDEKLANFRASVQEFQNQHAASFAAASFLLERTGEPLRCFAFKIDIDGFLIVYPGKSSVYIPDDIKSFFGSRIVVRKSVSRGRKSHVSNV